MSKEKQTIYVEQQEEPEHAVKLRITRRGKAVVGAALGLSLIAGGAAIGTEINKAIERAETPPELSGETFTVLPGDTLWNIAEDIDPNRDPREVVDLMQAANPDIQPGNLIPGDVLSIPIELAGGTTATDLD